MVSMRKAAVAALLLMSSFSVANAENTTVNKPVWKGHALDWCLTWATDCGKPAADKYCQSGGYEKSVSFSIWQNPGVSTRLIGSNQVCDEEECDSFLKIVCTKADAEEDEPVESEEVTYSKPMAGGRRLDWCLTWGADCGKPAANYYCKKKGHETVVDFKLAENIGKTRIMKTGEKCTMPECDGFKYITCE